MEQQHRMTGDNNDESSTTDVDFKPAFPGNQHPASTPTTPEASKKKRGKIRVKLHLFNKRRKAVSLESSMDSDGVLFGHSLATICSSQPGALPRPLMELLRTLYVHGPTVEGIFRRCANKTKCRSIRQQLDSGLECGPIDVHMASSLLTELLRKLPDCLLCSWMYDQWLESSSKTDQDDRISSLRQLVGGLPACNLLLLRHLICILHRIDRNSEQTKMTSKNLAVCLGPSLLWSNTATIDIQRKDVDRTVEAIRVLIDHAADIFGPDCLDLFRDSDSCSTTALPTDQQAATGRGIEATDHSLSECARWSNDDPSTTSLSQVNQVAPTTAQELPPVAPPRRKRSTGVAPPVFVSIAEESPSVQSATPIAADRVPKDKRSFARSLSSDSEVSGREWPVKSYGAETTDGEMMEDSGSLYGETTATEEELDGQRSSMLSEDLADEEDSSLVSPAGEERKDILNIQEHRKSSDPAAAAARRNASQVATDEIKNSKDLSRMDVNNSSNFTKPDKLIAVDQPTLNGHDPSSDVSSSSHTYSISVAKTRLSTKDEKKKNATPGLMSFSSTEEPIAGDRGATEKRLFFGSSFSSDADLSTFGESLDDGTAFSGSWEFPGIVLKKKQTDREQISNSSVSRRLLSSGDYHSREVSTVAYNTSDGKARENQKQLLNQSKEGWNLEGEVLVKAKANSSELDPLPINDSAADLCDSGISSVANETGRMARNMASQGTDTSDQLDSPRSSQPTHISGQSELPLRRHSLDCRDPVSAADICKTRARQRTGMTHKGSDIFPAILSKTLRSRATGVVDPNGWECDSLSGTESGTEGRGKRYYCPSNRLASDERIIVSDIELSESVRRTDYAPRRRDYCVIRGSQHLDLLGASQSPRASKYGRQWDSDIGESKTTKDALPEMNEEDEEKISSTVRLRLERPNYDETDMQRKSQQQPVIVVSLSNQEQSVLQEELQKQDERTEVQEKEVQKQPTVNSSTRQRRVGSVVAIDGKLDASALAQFAVRSCGDLSKVAKQKATDNTGNISRPEHKSELKHVSSLGALTTEDSLQKRFSISRSRKWSIRDNTTSSSSSNSDGETTLHQRLEDNQAKKRIRRRKIRRKARNSDTHLETDRENRVNLARSKSDSNTLLRELIFKKEDAEHAREIFRKEFFRRKADQRTFSGGVLQARKEGKENLINSTRSRVKNLEDDDRTGCELPSTTRESNRKPVALKDREWHKDLVREVESSQNSQSLRYPNAGRPLSGSERKGQRARDDSFSTSANKFKNSNSTGRASFTVPGSSKCVSKTQNGKTFDYSLSVKRPTDIEIRGFEPAQGQPPDDGAEKCRGNQNYAEAVTCGGNSGGSGSSRPNFIELRVNQLKKPDRDFPKDASQSKKNLDKGCTPREDISDTVDTPGAVLGAQKPHPRTNTRRSDKGRDNARDRLKEKTEMQSSRELIVQPVNKNNKVEDDNLSQKTFSDPCKPSISTFDRASVKDIVAIKNSSSCSASTENNSEKPPLPSSFRRGEERTEACHPETRRPVSRSVSLLTHGHVTPQSKLEVEISLTPELGRKASPRTEQKPGVSTASSMSGKSPSETNRWSSSVCARSHSAKSSNVRETEAEQKKNAERALSKPTQTTEATASTLEPSQRQRHGVSKSPWQAPPRSSASVKSSHEPSRSNVSSLESEKASLKSAAEACANDKEEKKKGGSEEAAAGQSIHQSQGSDSERGKSTKTEMPWSVANLRSFYGNQSPQ